MCTVHANRNLIKRSLFNSLYGILVPVLFTILTTIRKPLHSDPLCAKKTAITPSHSLLSITISHFLLSITYIHGLL